MGATHLGDQRAQYFEWTAISGFITGTKDELIVVLFPPRVA